MIKRIPIILILLSSLPAMVRAETSRLLCWQPNEIKLTADREHGWWEFGC